MVNFRQGSLRGLVFLFYLNLFTGGIYNDSDYEAKVAIERDNDVKTKN
ncbi:hypothetical protein CLOSBL3_12120 [Clostridiaceae bacterium BL-3]|nr:hypothetical protein CLOSBL3_12120 [Clostridiaceae bacterium BL-3]